MEYVQSGCLESLYKIALKGLNVKIVQILFLKPLALLLSCCKVIFWIVFKRPTNLVFFQNIVLIPTHERKNTTVEDEQSYKKTIQIKQLLVSGIFEEI